MNSFKKSVLYSVCNISCRELKLNSMEEFKYVKIRFDISKENMLIEILGNSTSLLVILLIGLSIYFGIQARTKNIK